MTGVEDSHHLDPPQKTDPVRFARLLDWADNWAGVLRVELTVHADNERAMALYRSMGFEEEGRHRAYAIKDGRYVDALCMARLHPNPPQIAG